MNIKKYSLYAFLMLLFQMCAMHAMDGAKRARANAALAKIDQTINRMDAHVRGIPEVVAPIVEQSLFQRVIHSPWTLGAVVVLAVVSRYVGGSRNTQTHYEPVESVKPIESAQPVAEVAVYSNPMPDVPISF